MEIYIRHDTRNDAELYFFRYQFLFCFGGGCFSDDTVTVGMSNSHFEPLYPQQNWLRGCHGGLQDKEVPEWRSYVHPVRGGISWELGSTF
jgi:hypothetical protein